MDQPLRGLASCKRSSWGQSARDLHTIRSSTSSIRNTSLNFLKDSFESDAARQRTHRSNRWFRLAYVGLGVALFIFLTLSLLPDRSDLYFQILQGLGLFGSGLAGGYGIRSYQDSK